MFKCQASPFIFHTIVQQGGAGEKKRTDFSLKIIDRFSPSWWWGKEGISSDPGGLCSSIFSRSSNGQGQRRPRQLDSPIVIDPLLVAGWLLFFWKALGTMGQRSGTWVSKSYLYVSHVFRRLKRKWYSIVVFSEKVCFSLTLHNWFTHAPLHKNTLTHSNDLAFKQGQPSNRVTIAAD